LCHRFESYSGQEKVKMRKVLNRPLTPHLTVYSSQYTSMYSIWHRITGVTLIFLIVFYLSYLKVLSYGMLNLISNLFYTHLWINNAVYLNTIIFFSYHTFNGLRHITWDLGFMLPIIKVVKSSQIINYLTLTVISIFLIKIMY